MKWGSSQWIFCVGLLFFAVIAKGQDVYKTPSGKKYHLSTCRMVENVSSKLVGKSDISRYDLSPCKICKPPIKSALESSYSKENKAVGTTIKSVQCKGRTKRGTRCKHRTKLANGYCYQHTSQNSGNTPTFRSVQPASPSSSTCGAKNKTGGYCKRKVKGGGRCYQHR